MTLIVTLNPEEQRWAREIAAQRIALAPGNPRFAYVERSGLDTHTLGCMAELAVAVGLGLEWPARVNTFRDLPDIDPYWEVRWSSTPKRVKIARDDKPDQLVCHVTGGEHDSTFTIHGCILAGWVQENTPLVDPGGRGWQAHFVDAYLLTPFDETFHTTCAWFTTPERGWHCVYCGKSYDKPLPAVLRGEDAGGRDAERSEEPGSAHPLPQPRRRKARARTPA